MSHLHDLFEKISLANIFLNVGEEEYQMFLHQVFSNVKMEDHV